MFYFCLVSWIKDVLDVTRRPEREAEVSVENTSRKCSNMLSQSQSLLELVINNIRAAKGNESGPMDGGENPH